MPVFVPPAGCRGGVAAARKEDRPAPLGASTDQSVNVPERLRPGFSPPIRSVRFPFEPSAAAAPPLALPRWLVPRRTDPDQVLKSPRRVVALAQGIRILPMSEGRFS